MNNKFCSLSVKERSQKYSCGYIYSLFSEQTWADFQAHDTGRHSLLRSLFTLKGKGKAADKVPGTNSGRQMELKADFVPSFVFLASPSLLRCDSSAWVGLGMSVKSQRSWLAEEQDCGTWLFIAGSRKWGWASQAF